MKKGLCFAVTLISLFTASLFADTTRSCTYSFQTGNLQNAYAILEYVDLEKYDVVTYQIKDKKDTIFAQTLPIKSNGAKAFLAAPCRHVTLFAILGKRNQPTAKNTLTFSHAVKNYQSNKRHFLFPSSEWKKQDTFF